MNNQDVSILIVDDEESARNGLATLLGGAYTCIAAASAEEAMRLLAARSFNLVLTDIHMPGASGLEVCRLVHRLHSNTAIIVISGMADIRYQVEALRQGTLYFMEKPIDPAKLRVLIESSLKSQKLSEARQQHIQKTTNPFTSLRASAS